MTQRIHVAYAKIFRRIVAGNCTISDLMFASGMTYDTVTRFLAVLRYKPRQIRICDWHRDAMGRLSIQVFELGTEPDAVRTKPKTGVERTREYKARKQRIAEAALQAAWRPIPETETETETV